eukprot:1147735-Pelagomonas_calceolata.AAC.2
MPQLSSMLTAALLLALAGPPSPSRLLDHPSLMPTQLPALVLTTPARSELALLMMSSTLATRFALPLLMMSSTLAACLLLLLLDAQSTSLRAGRLLNVVPTDLGSLLVLIMGSGEMVAGRTWSTATSCNARASS